MSSPYEKVSILFEKIFEALAWGRVPPPLFLANRSVLTGLRGESLAGVKRYEIDKPATSLKYAQVVAVAGIVLSLTRCGKSMSQRDVYYSLKTLFCKQYESNAIILELGLMLGLKRHEMGLYPAAKGLIAGLCRFRFTEGTDVEEREVPWTDCVHGDAGEGVRISSKWTSCPDGELDMQIPAGGEGSLPRPTHLIVVEKEGIFHRLVEDEFFISGVPCIIVTGCGYPDVPSRAAVARISQRYPFLQVVGLCDYNSYGLAVLLTYQLTSPAMRFEGEGFTCERMSWIGLRGRDVEQLQRHHPEFIFPSEHLQVMSEKDVGHARAMQKSKKLDLLPGPEAEALRDELETMLDLRFKLELESLYALGLDTLSIWITEKLS